MILLLVLDLDGGEEHYAHIRQFQLTPAPIPE